MKKIRWFRREILERFLDAKEMDDFETKYFRAKLVNIGKTKIGRSPFVF